MNSKTMIKIIVSLVLIVILISSIAVGDKAVAVAQSSLSSVSSSSVSSSSSTGSSTSSGSDSGTSGSSESSSSNSGSSSSTGSSSSIKTSASNIDAKSISSNSNGGSSRSYSPSQISEDEKPTNKDEKLTLAEIREKRIMQRAEKEKSENIEYIKVRFNISEDVEIEEKTVNELIQRRSADYENFKEITKLTTELIEVETDKEIFANELVNMDKLFVEKYSDALEKDSEINLKNQVNEYLNIIKNKEPVKIDIKETQIEDLFTKKIDMDSLIDEIWSS